MTTTYDFLSDIVARPQDDTPRLIYADWLEDHEGSERAEFIRVQCELARGPYTVDGKFVFTGLAAREEALRRRERELLGLHGHQWAREGLDKHWGHDAEAYYYWGRYLQHGSASNPMPIVFRRGFVAEVTCTLADWCGVECERCSGRGDGLVNGTMESVCTDCRGAGRTGGHGPTLVGAAPLERVRLSDCEPLCHTGVLRQVYAWAGGVHGPTTPYLLPDELFSLLDWGEARPSDHSHGYMGWPTQQAAQDVLSEASLLFAGRPQEVS